MIAVLGLVACGDIAEKNQATQTVIEHAEAASPVENFDVVKDLKKRPLDLSLPVEERKLLLESETFSEKKLLPDLFEQAKKEKNTAVSGKLLNDSANPDYFDSIEGAEVSVEIKTY